jgi:hypothetical protein
MKIVKFDFPNHEFNREATVEISETHIITKFVCKPDDPVNTEIIDLIAESYKLWDDKNLSGLSGTITIDDCVYNECFATHVNFGELDMCSSDPTINLEITWRYNSMNHI